MASVKVLPKSLENIRDVTVRFAGDSGDGMQLIGTRFAYSSVFAGNDVATFPNYPSEIRAPAGTPAGVSGFQIHFSSNEVFTPGDTVDALVAFNPAALKVNLRDLVEGGMVIANADDFDARALKLAGYAANPLEDGSLSNYQVHALPITSMTVRAVEAAGVSHKEADRCKNFFALGLIYWLYDRPMEPTLAWIHSKFADDSPLGHADELALRAGYNFARTKEIFPVHYHMEKAHLPPGTYRTVRGNEATALGLIAAAGVAGKELLYASYPITPASEILHELSRHKNYGVKTFQAEDEIAAMCAVVGAAYGGAFAATGTSGPGLALKTEALGLAVMLELPCVIVNVQRGGPSTGLPTKVEQADLLQAVQGRNGECPLPVLAPRSPANCFSTAYEAFQLAVRYMTPVLMLSDGFLANSTSPWRIPDVDSLDPFPAIHPRDPAGFQPYARDENLARPWAIPGMPGLAHRVGGLEKQHLTGDVSHDPDNHQFMCELRAQKINNIADYIPAQVVHGDNRGALLVVSWGGTYGSVRVAVDRAREDGQSVSHAHLRHLHPFPKNLGDLLSRFDRVLVPELNLGQLRALLRQTYQVDAVGCNKVKGLPLTVDDVRAAINRALTAKEGSA